jgi:glucan phosphoethanolaminetransferase (alkaline phosphatase superfamily)
MKLGKANAISVYVAWALLALFIVFFLFIFAGFNLNKEIIKYLFFVFLLSAFCHIIFAFFVRCPSCNKCITVQGFKTPHSDSDGSWSNTVAKWFSGSVVCIHCGQKVNTNDL